LGFAELGFDNKHFFNYLRCSSVIRKEWKSFITPACTGWDTVCCRCVQFTAQVPISCVLSARYFGKYLQRETGNLKVTVERRDRDRETVDW